MGDVKLDPEKHAGLSKVWTDAYGTEYGQDASTGQVYRLSQKGARRNIAHLPPIIEVEATVTPIAESTHSLETIVAATAAIATGSV